MRFLFVVFTLLSFEGFGQYNFNWLLGSSPEEVRYLTEKLRKTADIFEYTEKITSEKRQTFYWDDVQLQSTIFVVFQKRNGQFFVAETAIVPFDKEKAIPMIRMLGGYVTFENNRGLMPKGWIVRTPYDDIIFNVEKSEKVDKYIISARYAEDLFLK
jgi:hypothetical protein